MKNQKNRPIATMLFMSIFLLSSGIAQNQQGSYGVIQGSIINAITHEAIVGANVTLTGTTIGISTDPNGEFIIRNIPVGSYQLRASALGFDAAVRSDVVVSSGKPAIIICELNEKSLDVDEVVVVADFFQKDVEKPISVRTLGAEEIRRLPGGLEDVVRAVSILPGVAQVQAGRNDLIVRGGAPSENLFVVDNIEIPNINHFGTQGATGGPASFINLDYIQGTEFSSGGFGVRYGDKLSSVLSIDLKNGRSDRLGGKATISASQFGLNLEGPIDSQGSFIFSARRSYLDFIFKAAGFAFVPEYWDFLIKGDYKLTRYDNLSILSISAIDDVRQFNETREKQFGNSRILASDQYQGIAGLSWRHLFDGGFSTLTFGSTYFRFDTKQRDTALRPIFSNQSIEQEYSLRGDIVFAFSRNSEISAGIQGRVLPFASDITLNPFTTTFGEALYASGSYHALGYKSGAHVQLMHMIGHLRLIGGARIDYFNLIEKRFSISPRFSASYTLTQLTNLNTSIGRYHQTPSIIWLVANPNNRKLDFITVDQLILGIDHLLRDDIKINVEGYYKLYSDYPASVIRPYLVMANTGAGFGGAEDGFASYGTDLLVSNGKGTSRGIELLIQKKASGIPHYALASISYSVSEFQGLDGITRPSNFDQRFIVNIGGGYIFNERWEFSGKFRLATGRPYTPFNPDGTKNIALYNTERVQTNHSLDIRIDRRFNFGTWDLIAYIDVQNIYNRKPVDVPRYNTYTKTIEQTGSIGILPSIGLSAEF